MGCNTMEGLGKDVKRGGEKFENATDKAKNRRPDIRAFNITQEILHELGHRKR